MRSEDYVFHAAERRDEFVAIGLGLDGKNVDGGAGKMLRSERGGEGIDIDYVAAGGVDQLRTFFHAGELRGADHVHGLRSFRHVESHDIGSFQESVECGIRMRVSEGEFGLDIVEHDPHAERFGQHANLRADVSIADDAERFAAHLLGAFGGFHPSTAMRVGVAKRDPAHQQDGFGEHQFGYAAGVRKGRVENGDAALLGRVEVDLIGADAEAADAHQLLGAVDDFGGQLGLGADADEIGVAEGGDQLRLGERFWMVIDVAIAILFQCVDTGGVDALQDEDFDFTFIE